MNEPKRVRPIIILPPDAMSEKDMEALRRNGVCVVTAKDPAAVRFTEPPPYGYTLQEKAAIGLCRVLFDLSNAGTWTRREIAERYAYILIEGTPLSARTPAPVKRN